MKKTEPGEETRKRILDTAEQMLGQHGIAGLSLRQVTAKAGVNLAAVHYHFGSKEGLVKALVHRVMDPVNRERLRLLDLLEEEAGGEPVPPADLVTAFLHPIMIWSKDKDSLKQHVQMMGRVIGDPDQFYGSIAPEQFQQVKARFFAAFERSLPHLNPEQLFWRLMFMVGAMAQSMLIFPYAERMSEGFCSGVSLSNALEEMIKFTTAGFSDPVRKAAGK